MNAGPPHREAFGLQWHSPDLPLPELPEALPRPSPAAKPAPVQVEVREDNPAHWPPLPPSPHDTAFLQMARGDLRLTVEGIGRFRVSEGRTIGWSREPEGVGDQDLRTFLLGSAVGALLIQRGMLVLHGNALEKGGRAIVCLGHSGEGKSTLAYALMQQGWRLLADDLVAITPEGLVLPGIPRIKLWEDAALAFDLDPTILPPVREGMNKYLLMGEGIHRADQPTPLAGLYRIRRRRHTNGISSADEERIQPFQSQQAATLMLRNQAFRPRFVRGLGMEGANFLALARLQQTAPTAVLSLPAGIKAMERELESWPSTRPPPKPRGLPMKWALAMAAFAMLDHLIWLLVRTLPGPRLIRLSRSRPWRRYALELPAPRQQWWLARIRSLLRRRCRQDPPASSCLSRSLTGRLLLDLIAVPNELHLGMSLFPDGRKVPHGWLTDGNRELTPGLTPGQGVHLITL